MQHVPDSVKNVLSGVAPYNSVPFDSLKIKEIKGGQHNHIYRVRHREFDIILRISMNPSKRKDYFTEEMHNQKLAAEQGFAQPINYFNISDGTLIYDYVQGDKIYVDEMRNSNLVHQVFSMIRKLHNSKMVFRYQHDTLRSLVRRIRRTVPAIVDPPKKRKLEHYTNQAKQAIDLLRDNPVKQKPVHGDLILNNIIKSNSRLTLIDWQLSGMGDPHEEVANLIDACDCSIAESRDAIEAYLSSHDDFAHARIMLFWYLVSYYWILRHEGKIQNGEDVERYAKKQKVRMNEADATLNSATYAEALERLRDGALI